MSTRARRRAFVNTWAGLSGESKYSGGYCQPRPGRLSGAWLFRDRLFAMGNLQQAGSSDRYTLTFHVGDREASFEIRAGSVLNPFAPGMLRDFRCPAL